jgi:hypothetical protein
MFLFFVLILNLGIDTICVTKPFIASLFICYKEFTCLIPGLLYFIAIPSMSMLLFLYSIGNLHNVSWGTRETKTDNPEHKKTATIKLRYCWKWRNTPLHQSSIKSSRIKLSVAKCSIQSYMSILQHELSIPTCSTVTTCSVNSCKYTCSSNGVLRHFQQYLSFIVAVFLLYQCTKLGKWVVMYMCAKMIDLSFISTIVLLELQICSCYSNSVMFVCVFAVVWLYQVQGYQSLFLPCPKIHYEDFQLNTKTTASTSMEWRYFLWRVMVLWCFTPFSTIFQFYRGSLFVEVPVYRVRKMSGHVYVYLVSNR